MESKQIRQHFLDYFKDKGHTIVPSAPMVNKDDPTLMFTNAGMNQFKDFFLGTKPAPFNRAADTQKCLRVSGKHNDLEEVGLDTYHHTMFEMLGNWSFGDYFKKEAIEWAWELLTEVYKLPKDRLYATVFEGDSSESLKGDEDARELWKRFLPEDRILDGSKKDNFWEMGDTGPCGPCSEIHIDLRPESEIDRVPGDQLVNQDHPQVIEIWNLVFMEFNRLASGELQPLPQQHVDTGMGFERLCMAIQGKLSNYDTDLFQPLIGHISAQAGVEYGKDPELDIAMRVMADHIRAITFAISDGQLPSNTGAGYVIRRILRRAVRYAYTFLNIREPFLHSLLPILTSQFGEVFPELRAQQDFIMQVVEKEEESFLQTLENGLKRLEIIQQQSSGEVIDGKLAFELYDTYGFPFDLTSLIARENGLSVDEAGFESAMQEQKSRSKADAAKETGDWTVVLPDAESQFIGYDTLEADVKVVRYRTIKQKGKEIFQLVLDQTPFYAESGGQVGDTGTLLLGDEKVHVIDTKKENDLIVHWVHQLPAKQDQTYHAVVNQERRRKIMANHSATHLLHAALRNVLGDHVEQRGSLVNDKVLRFDFSHFQKMTDEEIAQVEKIVNTRIRQNIEKNEQRNVPFNDAREMGAMALFGEKYGDHVRVITFDPEFSVELCGGTHVPATGTIGTFKIMSEGSISAGIRRIEAVTGAGAESFLHDQVLINREIAELMKGPKDLVQSIKQLLDQKNSLEKELQKAQQEKVGQTTEALKNKARDIHGHKVILEQINLPASDALKQIGFELRKTMPDTAVILAADIEGKPQIAVVLPDALVANDLHAGKIVKELAAEIKGGGGGQPFFATAGGKDVSGLGRAIKKAEELIMTW